MTSNQSFKVYHELPDDFSIWDIDERDEPQKVLMCTPKHFDIVDVKNIHMEGHAGKFDKNLALQQWESLKSIYQNLLKDDVIKDLLVIDGAPGCEDMVFCANQTFPWQMPDGEKVVMMSKMRHESRQREVPYFEDFFKQLHYQPLHFKNTPLFEGMGDTIPHPGLRLLYGGYGHRSDISAYDELSAYLDVPVIALELVNPNFYHLDTCFVPLSEESVMICQSAFTKAGLKMISKCFEYVFLIPEEEAIATFCLNAHVLASADRDTRVAIIQKGSKAARNALRHNLYTIYEVDTSEFMKSGGSVFCMKMMVY